MDHEEIGYGPARHPVLVVGGRLMLAWALLGMPATSLYAFAQGLPSQVPTTTQIQDSVGLRAQDSSTSDDLINRRASRMLRNQYQDGSSVRAPRIAEEAQPVRTPKIIADPDDAAIAARQAARAGTKTRQEMVTGAQAGNDIGVANYQRTDLHNQENRTDRVDPGKTQTTAGRVNLTEVMPGFNSRQLDNMQQTGAEMYLDPAKAKPIADQHRRNLRRDGCRKTEFLMTAKQNPDLADTSPEHRIVKVEFFDLEKQPIPNTNPVEYQTITKPSTYKRGNVDLLRPTLGGVANVIWERVDDTYAIRYTYTPFTNPKGQNFFTYNHWLAVSYGAGVQRVYDPGMVSYGTPSDGWKTVAGYSVPHGVTAAYLTADLYQTQVTYSEPIDGQPCPPDPPETCQVPSIDGDPVRWCPGAFGSNIVLMYDDARNPSADRYGKDMNDVLSANASRKDYSKDPDIRAGVLRGVKASSSEKAKELVGTCTRDSISRIELQEGKTYGVPDMQMCSETLVNPYPDGVPGIKRAFGLTYVGEHNFLTVNAFTKVKVPIMDPLTGKQIKDAEGFPLYTYRKDPANVVGPILTDFTIMGAATCPSNGRCTTEKLPDDPRGSSEGSYVEYFHIPMGGDPKLFAFDGVYAQGGAQTAFTDYGKAEAQWLPTGTATADGTLHQVRLMAKAYSIPLNTFAGGDKYMQYVADGFCKGGKLTCTDKTPTRTIGDVTFGPGLPNRGIVDLLKLWGTESSAVVGDDYEGGAGGSDPTPNGPAINLLDDPMCWEAKGEPFTSCATMDVEAGGLRSFFKNNTEKWATDCNIATDKNEVPLETSASCKRVPALDSCDSRFEGLFTGQCYNPTLAYDCGDTKTSTIPVIVEELGDSCSGAMRCLGTECHRPNLAGTHNGDFAQALAGMEAVNEMVNDMVCDETGEPPTSVDQVCTPFVFGGKPMYCKIPIGNQIGLTPNCCKDTKKAASSAPNWMDYLTAMSATYKLMRSKPVMDAMANSDIYNQTSRFFGEIAKPVTDSFATASTWVTDKFITPFKAGFDALFGSSAGPVANTATGAAAKSLSISGVIKQFEQMLYQGIQTVLKQAGGEELAGMVFTSAVDDMGAQTGELVLTEGVQNLLMAFQVYSILRLIGHIVFACKKEEYEWAMNDKWRLCTFADSCCAKKVPIVGCVEKRQLYCCYKSIASRVISEQLVRKNLTAKRQHGYRTGTDGRKLGGCNINCGGFTAYELAAVDWSRVDLTEWTDALVESGMLNPADPRTNFGISQNTLKSSMAIGRNPDVENKFDYRAPALKTSELLGQNIDKTMEYQQTLKEEVQEHCYDTDNRKMPFTYPGCKTAP